MLPALFIKIVMKSSTRRPVDVLVSKCPSKTLNTNKNTKNTRVFVAMWSMLTGYPDAYFLEELSEFTSFNFGNGVIDGLTESRKVENFEHE